MTQPISRRMLLKGLGTAIALPWLEGMIPTLASAAPAKQVFPRRMAFFYVPNGVHMPGWTPTAEGSKFDLPQTLEVLKPFKQDLLVLSGLTCDKARPNGDGPGDHARAMASFLTGVQAKKTNGADIRVGVSVDQVAAAKIGTHTRFASLELGCEGGRQAGNCDSGYSCAYSSNLSWRGETSPMIKEVDPRQVFDRLFGNDNKTESDANRAKRDQYRKSILDFALDDVNSLKPKLGAGDQRKMDEYLTAIREIEARIAKAGKDRPAAEAAADMARPSGVPKEYQDHMRLLLDLLVLAFQTDQTRVATFVLANEGSNRPYRFIEVPEGHHDLSHHGGNKDKQDKIAKINRFHMSQFAYMLEKMKAIKEGDRTLLENCMLVYGSGNGDGNRHNHDDLPIILVGKGGGSLRTGRHVRYPKDTPLTNLYLGMLERVGAPTETLGDSTGRLEGLS